MNEYVVINEALENLLTITGALHLQLFTGTKTLDIPEDLRRIIYQYYANEAEKLMKEKREEYAK